MIKHETLSLATQGRGFYEITKMAREFAEVMTQDGLLSVFCRHTSASLIVTENADPAVRRDLERSLSRLFPDGDPDYEHDDEGPDDMPAHLRAAVTQTSVLIPAQQGRLMLGTWQGLYLWEHRFAPHQRQIVLSYLS